MSEDTIYLKSLAQCLATSKPSLNSNPRGFRGNLEFVLLWSFLFSQALIRPFWQFTACRHIYLAIYLLFALIDHMLSFFHPSLFPWNCPTSPSLVLVPSSSLLGWPMGGRERKSDNRRKWVHCVYYPHNLCSGSSQIVYIPTIKGHNSWQVNLFIQPHSGFQ